jgi:molybdopterin-binding protein
MISRGETMKISARNCLKGKVEKLETGPVTANIKIKIEAPGEITAVITRESVKDLDIKVGDEVVAIIKATEVMIGKE